MKNHHKIFNVIIFLIFVIAFIFLYVNFIINFYISPNNFDIPYLLLIGFGILLFLIFIFAINFNNFNASESINKKGFLNENYIKMIIVLLFFISLFIPPISFSDMIVDWVQLNIFNYLRATISIVCLSFIPGSSLFNILLKRNSIAERVGVESFLIKITLYPLISFIFLAFLTFLLDFLRINREMMTISLYLTIFFLYFLEIYVVKKRGEKLMFKEKSFKISRTSIMIMFLCLSIIIISLSITLSSQYLIPGDNWRGFKYAYYIGQPYTTPYTKFYGGYTLYWSYISFSISVLTGLPVLNANVILFPFLYLFVCSIYLFCKALMRTFKSTVSFLATITIVTFSGLFYFYNSNLAIHSKLLAIGIFQFSFHSFAFICLFCSLALFITISDPYFKNSYKRKEKAVVILLTVILMFHSYIIYFLPFILGFSFIFIYTIFSKNKKYSYNILLKICRYFIILFVLFDFLSNFYFSLVPANYSHYFFGTPQPQISNRNVLYYNGLIIYFLLIISYFFLYGIYFLDIKLLSFLKLRNGKKIKLLLIIVLGIYSILLELEIFLNLILKESQNFFLFSLNNTFINIGIIGILGIYFSYLLYKVNRRLYKILAVWLCFILILSFSLIIYNWIKYYNFLPYEIPNEDYYYMRYWFTRTWYISILPLSIFFSIGLVKILNGINENRKYKDKNISGKLLLKLGITSILIILALSNTIFSGIYWTDKGTGNRNKPVYINDEEANIMGWVSKNIPSESNILIDRYLLYHLIDIAFCPTYYIWDELKKAEENYNGWYSEYNTYPNCNLELTEDLDGKNKILSFYDESPKGSAIVKIHLNSNFTMGSIEFYSRYSDESKYTYLIVKNNDGTIGLHIGTNDEGFGYYNETDWNYIYAYQSNIWYHHKLNFYCNESSIGVFEWYINGTLISDNCTFQSYCKFLNYIELGTGWTETGGFYFWIDSFNITAPLILENLEEEILTINSDILINHLKSKDIKYFIVNRWNLLTYDKLIERHFNQSLYQYGNLLIFKSV